MAKSLKKSKEKYVKVCTKCKSPDVHRDISTKIQGVFGLPSLYVCNKCGHSGHVFPEILISKLEKFEKKVDKKHLRYTKKDKTDLVDSSFGKFEVRFWWKISGPITLIVGIFLLLKKQPENIYGIFLMSYGIIITYITYFKKRKLRE